MDYFQGVVNDYLQESRGMFVRAECPIQLHSGKILPKGTFWYCDAVAVDFKEKKVYLCEVSYSSTLHALAKRLEAWSKEWPTLRDRIRSDHWIPDSWQVQPWVFVPEGLRKKLDERLSALAKASSNVGEDRMPTPEITHLESVVPWKYRERERASDATQPNA